MKPDPKELNPLEIIADAAWNSRDVPIPGKREMTDEELEESIRQAGLLQAVRVRRVNDAWQLVFGFRRLRAWIRVHHSKPIPVTVMQTSGDLHEDDKRARLENFAENGPRLALRPHEMAQACFDLRKAHPDVEFKEIAAQVGLSEKHVERLTRIREKLCPTLWDAWKANPDRFTFNDLLSVCPLPHSEQVSSYNDKRIQRKGGRPKGSRTAHAVNMRDVSAWKETVEEKIRLEKDKERKAFLRGMRAAFESAENGELNTKEPK